jgi:hypothetical protein
VSIAPLEADLKKRGANAVLVPFERQIRELWGMGNGDFTRVAWKVHQHCGHLDAVLQEWKERKQTQASLQQPVTKKRGDAKAQEGMKPAKGSETLQ